MGFDHPEKFTPQLSVYVIIINISTIKGLNNVATYQAFYVPRVLVHKNYHPKDGTKNVDEQSNIQSKNSFCAFFFATKKQLTPKVKISPVLCLSCISFQMHKK